MSHYEHISQLQLCLSGRRTYIEMPACSFRSRWTRLHVLLELLLQRKVLEYPPQETMKTGKPYATIHKDIDLDY